MQPEDGLHPWSGQDDHGQAARDDEQCRSRESLAHQTTHPRFIPVGEGLTHLGEQRREDRRRDEAVRQHEDEEGIVIGRHRPRHLRVPQPHPRQQALGEDTHQLGDEQGAERPHRDARRGTEPMTTQPEPRTPTEPPTSQWDDEEQPLHGNAQGGEPGQHPDHLTGPGGRVGVGPPLHEEPHQTGDLDEVGQYRAPHECRELAASIEHLTQNRVQTVEEDLRHDDEPEQHRQLAGRSRRREVQVEQPRGGHRGEHRHDEDHPEGGGEQPVDEVLAPVGLFHRLGDLGDEDGVEHPCRQQDENDVGQGVGGLEGVQGQ